MWPPSMDWHPAGSSRHTCTEQIRGGDGRGRGQLWGPSCRLSNGSLHAQPRGPATGPAQEADISREPLHGGQRSGGSLETRGIRVAQSPPWGCVALTEMRALVRAAPEGAAGVLGLSPHRGETRAPGRI